MADPQAVAYIRKYRDKFPDKALRAQLRAVGHSDQTIEAAFAEIDRPEEPPPEAAPPKKPGRGRPLLIGLAVIAAAGAGAFYAYTRLTHRDPPAVQLPRDSKDYEPEPFTVPKALPTFLPEQAEGNAGEDYHKAIALLLDAGYKCGQPIDEAHHAEAIGLIEAGIAKKDSAIVGVLKPFSVDRQSILVDRVVFAKLACFSRVFRTRGRRLENSGEFGPAETEYGKGLALGFHMTRDWEVHGAFLGVNVIAASLARLETLYKTTSNEDGLRRVEFAKQELQTLLCRRSDIAQVSRIAADPTRLELLSRFLEHERGLHIYGPLTLTEAAFRWSDGELKAVRPSVERLKLITEASKSRDPRLAALGKARLKSLQGLHKTLRSTPPGKRSALRQDISRFLSY